MEERKEALKVIKFSGCQVEVFPEKKHLATVFPDGTRVEACPNNDEESLARAASLGFPVNESGLWLMTVTHEVGHSILAEMDNLEHSPALWKVAHPEEERDVEALHLEECRVLEMQRFLALTIQRLEPVL